MKRLLGTTAVVLVFLTAAGCASGDHEPTTTITVYAASSLTDVFTEIGAEFEKQHDGVQVEFSFGGSSDLVAQLQAGAPADVFASADAKNMDKLVADGLDRTDPVDFASNTLEIITPPDNPAGITSLADLTRKDLNLVVCAPEVPCGAATVTVGESAGLTFKPVSEEQSVKDVLVKVASGEADAGLVYVTDVKAAGDTVKGIVFPEAANAVNVYPITTVKDGDHARLAQAFVDLVRSGYGRRVLADAGFGEP